MINELKDFPDEIVNKMLNAQKSQGNKTDVSVFNENLIAAKILGGFNWAETIEGLSFWSDVIHSKNFDRFFEMYPKQNQSNNMENQIIGYNLVNREYSNACLLIAGLSAWCEIVTSYGNVQFKANSSVSDALRKAGVLDLWFVPVYSKKIGLVEKDLSKITRVEVIDSTGRAFTNYKVKTCELSYQDDDRTLKIFIS